MDSSYLRSLRENALQGQVPTFNAATARFELGFPSGVGAPLQQLFVTTTGSDATGDGSQANPFATPQRAVDALGPFGSGVIHLASGTYPRPILRNLLGAVGLFGDGGGVAGDDGLTELQGATVAGAGTTASFIDGAFAAGAFDGKILQMLTGAAAGYRRTISDTQVGGLVPLKQFNDQIPAPGDSFRIVEPAVVFDSFNIAAPWITNCGSVDALMSDSLNAISAVGLDDFLQTGIYLCSIMCDGGFGAGQEIIRDSNVFLYGVAGFAEFQLNCNNSCLFVGTDDTDNARANNLAGLLGLTRDQFAGMGAFFDGPLNMLAYRMARSTFVGFVQQPEQAYIGLGGSLATLMGGRLLFMVCQDTAHAIVKLENTTIFQIGEGNTPIAVQAVAGAQIDLQSDGLAIEGTVDGIKAQQGGVVWATGGLSSTGTAGAAMNCSQGGRGFLRGDPTAGTWAGGVNGFQVSATEDAAAAAFGAIDDTLVAAVGNGSIITRVF